MGLLNMTWVDVRVLAAKNIPPKRERLQISEYVARRAKPRFYADENFPALAVAIIREMGARVTTVQEVSQRGHPDENHAAYALRNGLALLTFDRDFLDKRRFPLIHCPAIFVFDFCRGTGREMKQSFGCLVSIFLAPQLFDKWCKVDARPDSWTEYARFLNGSTARTRYRLWRGRMEEWVEP
jgi:hypothetical protein